jgi:bifunctional DNA-binding transcriptional regulator/antitoxin component of YhaV-PrlF toxin-antitoxin module
MDVGSILRSDLNVGEKVRALAARGLPRVEIARRLGAFMEVEEVVRSPEMTLADKIRALDAGGLARAEIARRLGKRYQHVRNVLEGDKLRAPATTAAVGVEENGREFEGGLRAAAPPAAVAREIGDVRRRGSGAFRLVVREDGSLVLPREVRDAFGIEGRAVVMGELVGDEFRLISTLSSLKRAQDLLRPYMQDGVSWADDLIAERRREAQGEASGD